MKESKFTPGPWKVSIRPLAITVWADAISLYPIAHIGERNRDEKEANAHLIAAAPDLLAACERGLEHLITQHDKAAYYEYHQHCTGCEVCQSIIPELMSAIAKAKGGEQ